MSKNFRAFVKKKASTFADIKRRPWPRKYSDSFLWLNLFMIKIVDNKIWKDGEKIGWLDGHHIRTGDGTKLGYCQDAFVFNEAGHKVAYIHENNLVLQN